MQNDPLIEFNRERWEHLARNRVIFSRPWLDLDEKSAKEKLDPSDLLGDVAGARVLCLASGGGQQSVAFSLLGARVTVLDFSSEQLERDWETAAVYGFEVDTVEGDMRDLSVFADEEFDIVWQPPSINYVREASRVIAEAGRVLKPGGHYFLEFSNPFAIGIEERSWNGTSYPLKRFYTDGELVDQDFDEWEVWDEAGNMKLVTGPRQFRHTLATVINALSESGFVIRRFCEQIGKRNAEPGTWEHFTAIAPPILGVWSAKSL